MKIAFTGGGSGGHFFPIIAVAQEIWEVVQDKRLLKPKLHYLAPEPYDKETLYNLDITYHHVPSGKVRRYFSLKNIFDPLKLVYGIFKAFLVLYSVYPDVIFSKGGYGAFPTLFAARLLRIPVIIHESDSVPGRVNKWSAKFAERIAISFPEAAHKLPKDKVAYTGQPIRQELRMSEREGAHEYLKLASEFPTIFILGGSLGSQRINDVILNGLPKLVPQYNVIHQVGEDNLTELVETARVILEGNPFRAHYKPFGFLNTLAMRMSAGASDVVVSRGGSTIYEIAAWGKPSIIIPINEKESTHQTKNAYTYARTGAAVVIEESNLSDDILISQINEILQDKEKRETMETAAKDFAKPGAARMIAEELIKIALEHER